MKSALVSLLHLSDSLFPIGSFSHSDGLEAATASGGIGAASDMHGWMEASLEQTLGRFEGPAVARAWAAWTSRRLEALIDLDQEVHALRPSSSGRAASRGMGTRLLKTWGAIHLDHQLPDLASAHGQVTLSVAFGVVAAAAGIPQDEAIQGFMYTRLAGMVSAAMRLMPLGQREAHHLLATCLSHVPGLVEQILADPRPLQSFAPLMDMAAINQQYVHSRLFRS